MDLLQCQLWRKYLKNFCNFIEIVDSKFKTLAEAATCNAQSTAQCAEFASCSFEIAALKEAARIEIEEKEINNLSSF